MTMHNRLCVFAVAAVVFGGLYGLAAMRCIGAASVRDRYADQINLRSVPERNCTDAVTSVNFDYRGFDTLGEEFILFASVMGALVLLRKTEGGASKSQDLPDAIDQQRDIGPTDATRVWTAGMVGPKLVLGLYLVTHGQLSPGGGFQGGVVLATAVFIIYLAENMDVFKRVVPHAAVELFEAVGAGSYVLIGLLAVCAGAPFLTNVLPLGKSGEPTSAGTMPLISLATGIEVAAGFVLLIYGFLEKNLDSKGDR